MPAIDAGTFATVMTTPLEAMLDMQPLRGFWLPVD
jgi:hypothetical protein